MVWPEFVDSASIITKVFLLIGLYILCLKNDGCPTLYFDNYQVMKSMHVYLTMDDTILSPQSSWRQKLVFDPLNFSKTSSLLLLWWWCFSISHHDEGNEQIHIHTPVSIQTIITLHATYSFSHASLHVYLLDVNVLYNDRLNQTI